LAIHSRRHADEATKKCHACEVCGKKFSFKKYLKYHLMRHAGNKPHVCPHCKAGFADKNTLTKHISTHTRPMQSYPCDICDKEFSNPKSYRVHKKKHHPSPSVSPRIHQQMPTITSESMLTEKQLLEPWFLLANKQHPHEDIRNDNLDEREHSRSGSPYLIVPQRSYEEPLEREQTEEMFLLADKSEPTTYEDNANFSL